MSYHNYTNFNRRPFNPKAAVKQFTDLEVYQKSLEACVFVASEVMMFWEASRSKKQETRNKKQINSKTQISNSKHTVACGSEEFGRQEVEVAIIKTMSLCALSIPHLIAEAHSKRFGTANECLHILDEVMLKCNKMAVYLEQTRDICQTGIEANRFEEEINKYFYIRRKVLNLQRVWRKYINENKKQ